MWVCVWEVEQGFWCVCEGFLSSIQESLNLSDRAFLSWSNLDYTLPVSLCHCAFISVILLLACRHEKWLHQSALFEALEKETFHQRIIAVVRELYLVILQSITMQTFFHLNLLEPRRPWSRTLHTVLVIMDRVIANRESIEKLIAKVCVSDWVSERCSEWTSE